MDHATAIIPSTYRFYGLLRNHNVCMHIAFKSTHTCTIVTCVCEMDQVLAKTEIYIGDTSEKKYFKSNMLMRFITFTHIPLASLNRYMLVAMDRGRALSFALKILITTAD